MDEYEANTFANRDAAIPVLNIPMGEAGAFDDDEPTGSDANTSSDQAPDAASDEKDASTPAAEKRRGHVSFQDRMFSKLLEQLIPSASDDGTEQSAALSGPSSAYIERPGFSVPLMTNNFRRFNARIGVVFVFQARAIRLFSWRTPSHTLSFLAIYSFVCIYPFLLAVAPICVLLLFVMVPAYLARHPPPPTDAAGLVAGLSGPALAPPRVVKPAPELSHDSFRNMRDLQNVMADFATMHDAVLAILTPWTNFADEGRASALFLSATVIAGMLALAGPLIPFRTVALLGGWALIGAAHPRVQAWTSSLDARRGKPARRAATSTLQSWIASDFALDDPPEILEVEIFELQRRREPSSFTSTFAPPTSPTFTHHGASPVSPSEYEPWLFAPAPWEPQAPARRAGARPTGTRFFEDVQPPPGWAWVGKKWVLDLSGEAVGEDWVAARMLRGLEVEREGERWVYDLVDVAGLDGVSDGRVTSGGAAVGERKVMASVGSIGSKASAASKASTASNGATSNGGKSTPASKATTASNGTASTAPKPPASSKKAKTEPADNDKEAVVFRGEWRRRRWVRSVKRAKVEGTGVKVVSDGGPALVRGKGME